MPTPWPSRKARADLRHPAGLQARRPDPVRADGTEVLAMTAIAEPEVGDPPLPPVPDGAVMVTLKIARFNPGEPRCRRLAELPVPCLPSDRLLNLLLYVKGYLDGTLTFRRSCAHGVRVGCHADQRCQPAGVQGADARPVAQERKPSPSPSSRSAGCPWRRTSWSTWSRSSTRTVRSSRSSSPPAIRLRANVFRARPTGPATTTPPRILCACRTTSCPVYRSEGSYPSGPAAIVNAHRFIFDSRRGLPPSGSTSSTRSTGAALPHHLQLHRGLARVGIEVTKAIQGGQARPDVRALDFSFSARACSHMCRPLFLRGAELASLSVQPYVAPGRGTRCPHFGPRTQVARRPNNTRPLLPHAAGVTPNSMRSSPGRRRGVVPRSRR